MERGFRFLGVAVADVVETPPRYLQSEAEFLDRGSTWGGGVELDDLASGFGG